MDYAYKTTDDKIGCLICYDLDIESFFSSYRNLSRHCKIRHPGVGPVNHDKCVKVKLVVKNTSTAQAIHMLSKQLQQKDETISQVLETVNELKTKMGLISPSQTTQITQNITNNNNINIYFNKDLKYYPELVKLFGRKNTCDYLLFTMPESKDIFGVIDKLFMRNGISHCPIRVGDDNEFIVTRSETEFVHDPTGELIDRENKSKLQDAVLSAYIDSTKHINDECEQIRRNRVNGEYSEHDMETINKRFDGTIEPSRPYDVIDIMNGIKPKKKDFDKLRKICPKVVKKIVA